MPIATSPDPISPSAIAGGVRLEPVNGSGFRTGAFVVVDDDRRVVVVDAFTRTVVDVEPKPVTGVVAVLVVDLDVVGVVGGTVVAVTAVVVDAAVDDVLVLVLVDELDGEAVVLGATVLVVSPGVQSDSVCSACAEPPPSDDDHESFACTTCVPAPRLSATASVTSEVVTVKSRSTTVLPSTVIDSCAVVDASLKLW
jgi:hypothetical protein